MTNYMTAEELREVALAIDELNEITTALSVVSMGDIDLFDANGELIGLLRYENGHRFYPGKD